MHIWIHMIEVVVIHIYEQLDRQENKIRTVRAADSSPSCFVNVVMGQTRFLQSGELHHYLKRNN